MSNRITKEEAKHPVAWLSGVQEGDSKIEAAEKAIATMRLAGFSARDIKKAERMVEEARARGVT
jgi:hypothetical protein